MASETFTPTSPTATGSGQYRWSTLANWSGGTLPDQNTTATLSSTASGYTLLMDASYTVGSLIFGAGFGQLTLSLGSGDTLNGGNMDLIAANSTLMVGGSGTLSATGFEVKTNATFTMQSGTLSVGGSGLMLDAGSNTTFSSGVTLSVNALTLNGAANLTLSTGSAASPHLIQNVNTSGSGAKLTEVAGDLQIGSGGSGTFAVTGSGTIEFTGSLGSSSVLQLQGGTMLLDNAVNLQTGDQFAFSGSTASTLDVVSSNNFQNGFSYAVGGFDYGDKLEFGSLSLTGDTYSYSASSKTLNVVQNGSSVLKLSNLSLASDVSSTPAFVLSGNTVSLAPASGSSVACFLTGSLIETEFGPQPIEHLQPGQRLVTLEAGRPALRPVRWVGHRLVNVPEQADEGDYPVRIRESAFGPGLPRRDLLLTAEHCLFVEGVLIPVRMLVNASSIRHDLSLRRFAVHHVELDRHSIILAEDLATESYLDTGNRASFGLPQAASASFEWSADAAAPLETRREAVEPIWLALACRAAAELELPAAPVPELSAEPELRILLDDQQSLAARWISGERHLFHIPAGRRATHLLSRAARPSEIIGPFVDDRRRLGVAVRQIALWNGLDETVLHGDLLSGAGWHAPEDGQCWTDGRAALALPPAPSAESFLDVRIAATMRYPAVPHAGSRAA